MASLDKNQRFDLIKENLAEVLNPEIIESMLSEGRSPKIYWGEYIPTKAMFTSLIVLRSGTATTGRPHCGYFVPAIKLGQFLQAGCEVKCLIADIHGFLDSLKAPLQLVEHRAKYYQYIISAILESVGVPTEKLQFVLGSSYQKSSDYVMDVYKLSALTSEHDAKKAGAEVVKQSSNSPLSGLLYPILQTLDEQYLDVDAQFGGLDQRKLFTAAKEWLPKIGYRPADSKIDLLDSPDVVTKKIRKAVAVPKVVEDNGLLAFVEFVLLPASALNGQNKEFVVDRSRDGLEPLVYSNIQQMHEDYKNDVLSPQILKPAVAKVLNDLLAPIQAKFQASPEWQEVALKAYPPEEKPKKEKKIKDRGTGFPGSKNAPQLADRTKTEQVG
ncbi:MAG: hypothetical protein Q9160_003276 [Pyrenula sp. 1 TL-2023]